MKCAHSQEGVKPRSLEPIWLPGQAARLQSIQSSHSSLTSHFTRAWSGKCSPRAAIKAQCLDCCGLDRVAVAECADRCCPLWHFKPYAK
jgi:hypothetical protein